MLQKLPNFKIHMTLILLLCLGTGILFAFVTQEYWNKIQYENMNPENRIPSFFLYGFCLLSYLFLGLSFGIISEHSKKKAYKTAVLLFWLQFILIFLWPGIFFGLQFFGTALTDLFIAFMLLIFTFSAFRKIDIIAAYMLLPYGCLLIFFSMINAWFFIV